MQLIFVSAGFDAADGDMGETCVSKECFADLTSDLLKVKSCKGRVVMALEGGYVRSVLSSCVASCLAALIEGAKIGSGGESKSKSKSVETEREKCGVEETRRKYKEALADIHPSARKSILDTIEAHAELWECFEAFRGQ